MLCRKLFVNLFASALTRVAWDCCEIPGMLRNRSFHLLHPHNQVQSTCDVAHVSQIGTATGARLIVIAVGATEMNVKELNSLVVR